MVVLVVLFYSFFVAIAIILVVDYPTNCIENVGYRYKYSKFNIRRQIRKEKRRIRKETDPEREELLEELEALNRIRMRD